MFFVSSYEQNADVLIRIKRQLTSSGFQELYEQLQKFHLSEVEFITVRTIETYLPSLLQQMQVAAFLGTQNDNCYLFPTKLTLKNN